MADQFNAVDGALTPELRLTALRELVVADPGMSVAFFDDQANGTEPPQDLIAVCPKIVRAATVLELVDPEDTTAFVHAWALVVRQHAARHVGATADEPGFLRRWSFLDLRETHGCIAVLIGSQQQDLDGVTDQPIRSSEGVMKVDGASVTMEADPVALSMLGYQEHELIGKSSLGYLHPDDHESAVLSWLSMLEHHGAVARELLRYRKADGEWMFAEVTHHNLLETQGYIERRFIDVTERVTALVESETKDRVIMGIADVLPSGIAHFDHRNELVFANDRWNEIVGGTAPGEAAGYIELITDPPIKPLQNEIIEAMTGKGFFDGEVTMQGPTFRRRCRMSLRVLRDTSDRFVGTVVCLDDITESWRLQKRLADQANRDSLTGLSNRNAVLHHLDEVLAAAGRDGGITAVAFLDLNGFKRVNDVLGHSIGDDLLRQVAQALLRVLRPQDLVGRLGGDEFLLVLRDLESPADAMRVARRALDAVTGRFRVADRTIESSASCGVAINVGGSQTAERMIAEADLAMYEQKRNAGQDPGLFEPTMFEDQRLELNRDAALRSACDDGSLVMHYQPIVQMASGATVGYEALVRWRFEDRLAYPDEFIGLAERRGLIGDIGLWVVEAVFAQAAAVGDPGLFFTLNISPAQLSDGRLDDDVALALERHQVNPAQIGIELTEGILVTDESRTTGQLRRLADMGVRLLVDDFGTGFASLDYLRSLPVTGLKIDRCFTTDIDRDRTRAIVRNVVTLARELDLRLVCEGIETESQAEQVQQIGASLGQGYLFSRPQPFDDVRPRGTSVLSPKG